MEPEPDTPATTRVFIVGCPRSGTTFLQNALARHPLVLSLPETAFFEQTAGDFDHWLWNNTVASHDRALGRAPTRAHQSAPRIFRDIAALTGKRAPWPLHRWSLSGYTRLFTRLMDAAATHHGRTTWIEKTPNHIAYIDTIEATVPNAHFIHLVRSGEDVIASLVDVAMQYDVPSQDFDHAVPRWVRYWNRAADTHLRHAGSPKHLVLFYEDLIEDFDAAYLRICTFLGLPSNAAAAKPSALPITDLNREPWKQAAVTGGLRPARSKFNKLFGPDLQAWIRKHLLSYDELRAVIRHAQGLVPEPSQTSSARSLRSRLR